MFDLMRPLRVIDSRKVGVDAFYLRVDRRWDFHPGQHVDVGLPGEPSRPYSICSPAGADHLEVLIRRVPTGRVSSQLAVLAAGDGVRVDRPRGRFTLAGAEAHERVLLVATGTGIAPFRSFMLSHPDRDFTLVHGVRDPRDDFGSEFAPRRVLCVSGSDVPEGAVRGRVTTWLAQADLAFDRVFLCGNARMVFEAYPLLVDRGIPEDRIHTETYF